MINSDSNNVSSVAVIPNSSQLIMYKGVHQNSQNVVDINENVIQSYIFTAGIIKGGTGF